MTRVQGVRLRDRAIAALRAQAGRPTGIVGRAMVVLMGQPSDKILAVNAAMFWGDPVARLTQLRRLLRPGGLIAVVHQPRGPGATDATAAARGREMAAALDQAGFSSMRLKTLRLKPAVVCALGINGAET